jgi:hypothetical protein
MSTSTSARAAAAAFRARVRVALALGAFSLILLFLNLPSVTAPRPAPIAPPSTPARGAFAARAAPRGVRAKPAPRAPPTPRLLSAGKPVLSDVRGNLAPADVVTRAEPPGDWLTDRWQSASDMSGTPIPGAHFLEVDLGAAADIARVVIIWETALATKYRVRGRQTPNGGWADLALGADAVEPRRDAQHVVHVLEAAEGSRARIVRLVIDEPATKWGASVWRLEVWGTDPVVGED